MATVKKSFPDLNKDGKVTKADILKGRGVIAKSGMKMKKQAATAIAMKKAGVAPKKMMKSGGTVSMELGSYGRQIGKNYTGKAKSGASMMKRGGMMKKGC